LYGLMLLLAIAACVALTGYRWVRWGGDWDLVFRVAVWGVAAGIVGARLYHDITSWNEVPDKWWGPFAVWQGGLGVWGGILFGVLAGAWIVRRSGQSVRLFMDAVAPGLLLAQGIGRIGNWFNQELFGKPTDLPWGLEIDPQHRPPGYFTNETFHPTFLYELTYDLIGVAMLLWIDRRFNIRRPALFALYVSYYCFGRFFEELLRIDPAHHFLGLRVNAWVSIVAFVLSTAFFIWWQFIRNPSSDDRPRASRTIVPTGPAMSVPKGRVRSGR
jgi:prolipoprotein diacylglyceryl transferase